MSAADERSLRERREAVMADHIAAENIHDVEATIATMHRPRYELNGEPSDGEAAVRGFLQELMTAFPDFHLENEKVHHADEAVIAEARVTATHTGPLRGIPPTGRALDYPVACIYEFEGDRIVCEKLFLDFATVLRQIGVLPEPAGE